MSYRGQKIRPTLIQADLRRALADVMDEQDDRAGWPVRDHHVTRLTAGELERAQRELRASLALVRPNSPAGVPIMAHLSAIDAELATRTAGVRLCSCGFASDDRDWFDGHLFQHPGHYERNHPGLPLH